MRKAFVSGLIISFSFGVCAESVTNNLDVQGGFIYNHGMINPGDMGMTFTNAGIRDVTVSSGQLSGVDPETGAVITNAANLLSLKAESLTTVSNITAGGTFIGDGSGLSNLNVNAFSGSISASSLPTSGVWNASGVTITNASLAGNVTVSSLTVATNLTVQGVISGNGSGLTGVTAGAGGSDGSFQFNNNGVLSGDTNFFIHPTEHKPAFRSPSGNFFRGYSSETISDSNLIYSVRNENGTSVLRLRENGQDTIRLSGDGTAYIKGNLQLDGQLIADGSGITNLPVQAQVDALIAAVSNSPAATITTNQIASWNSGGTLAESVQISPGTVNITTNLIVQGTISGDGSGLTGVAASAGGSSGSIQFNDNGLLSGNPNLFIHPTEKKPAFRSPSGNFFRGYNSETLSDNNLIYSLRNENGTSVLRLRENGQDKIVLSGDGSITLNGQSITNWPSGGGSVTNELDPLFTNWLATTEIVTGTVVRTESDPAFSASAAATVTATDVTGWNAASVLAADHESRIPDLESISTSLTSGLGSLASDLSGLESRTTNLESQATGMLLLDGTRAMQASLDMGGHSITNISTNSLVYADGQSVGEKYVDVAGDTMTGTLTLQTNLLAQGQIIVGSSEFAEQTISNAVTGSLVVEGIIHGDGSGLMNVNVSHLTGTISIDNLPPEALQPGYSDADAVSAVETAYPNLAEAVTASEVVSIVSSNGFATTNQLAALTAADLGAYTTSETDTAISNAMAGIQAEGYVATNHVGDISIDGGLTVQQAATFNGALYVSYLPAQGDLSMGSYTNRP